MLFKPRDRFRVQVVRRFVEQKDIRLLQKQPAQRNAPALTAGLTRVLPEWATEALPLHALYYKNRGFAPTVRSFIDWLAATVG